jgi:hypothetical protein
MEKLAETFDGARLPYPWAVFHEVSALCFGGIAFGDVADTAVLPPPGELPPPARKVSDTGTVSDAQGLRLVAYRPLFSGAAVEHTPELEFQRPLPEVYLARGRAIAQDPQRPDGHGLVERHVSPAPGTHRRRPRRRRRAHRRGACGGSPRDGGGHPLITRRRLDGAATGAEASALPTLEQSND